VRFTELRLKGVFLIEFDRRADHRGFFARSWCSNEFRARGLQAQIAQINVCHTDKSGGIRGLHFQVAPHCEAKIVRCTNGGVFDVAVDLRPASPTYMQWLGLELDSDNHNMLYIPEGCAHGCQALVEHTEIEYLTTAFYAPEAARGIRFDDPAFRIEWPLPLGSISEADRSWPDFEATIEQYTGATDGN